jgi:hypothetical protein
MLSETAFEPHTPTARPAIPRIFPWAVSSTVALAVALAVVGAGQQNPLPTLIPSTYAGKPFSDARHPEGPQKIPGRLQCELFDSGGQGVAYSDTDDKNSGSGGLNPLDGSYLNGFRANEAVDTSYTKDNGQPTQDFSEYNLVMPERDSLYVGWTETGEWVSYTVAAERTGTYALDVMYTSNGEGRFDLVVDDVLRGTITLPTTHQAADPVD